MEIQRKCKEEGINLGGQISTNMNFRNKKQLKKGTTVEGHE